MVVCGDVWWLFFFPGGLWSGLDIGYVPAGPDAFFRWSGQFGPQQLIFYWPAGPGDLGLPFIFEKCYEGGY